MKRVTTFLLLLFNLTSSGQTNVKAILDAVLLKTKETSMYITTVNWDSLQKQVYVKAENAKTIQDLKPAFEILLNGLRDHHGKILNAKDYGYIAWFTDNKNRRHVDDRKFDNEVWKIVNDTASKFEYKLLKGRIGYLKIVGIPSNADVEKESIKIRESIISLTQQKADKWIIDLRYNAGGNMNPMMAGIAPLVGNGIVGSVVDLKNEKLFDWEIKSSNFIYGGYQAVTLPDNVKFKTAPKIAVLTSRWTVSSGEIVATSFKGRPNTKFFGETTGGYTTNDGWEVINDAIILVISTGTYCDRTGKVYDVNIPVDTEIPFTVTKNTEKDNCILAAKKWLTEK
jgi:carboxyl-terminal processing protease